MPWNTSYGYPQSSDLNDYIIQLGITTTKFGGTGSDLSTVLNLARAVEAGANLIEKRCKRVFLADPTTPQVRQFDPPINRNNEIDLMWDVYSISQVSYQPFGSTEQILVAGEEYWFEPLNYAELGVPIKFIKTWRVWMGPISRSLRGAIKVTGKWAYGAILPAEITSAMLAEATKQLMPNIKQAYAKGLISWEEAGVRETKGANPLDYLKNSIDEDIINPAVMQYRRWRL